jgi:catechol 2,3-dioxygenase-like lactoylglutathione lyase family enzyme
MTEHGIDGNVVTQIAIVVRDIEQAVATYSQVLGVEPPTIITTDPDAGEATYHGERTRAQAKLAFFDLGPQVQLELIEPVGEPSVWKDVLDQQGEGVHHIAFKVRDTKATTDRLAAQGMPVTQQGLFDNHDGMYTYVDSAHKLGVIVELLEIFDKS